jgi:hypothetical protein
VPHEELQPHKAWGNEDAYNSTLTHLARLFVNSFKQYLEVRVPLTRPAGSLHARWKAARIGTSNVWLMDWTDGCL